MKIYRDDDYVYLQLRDMKHNVMLFDFKVEKEAFSELREHMIEHLNKFEV